MSNIMILDETEREQGSIVTEIIFETYKKLFEEGSSFKKYVPSTREIFDRIRYDIDAKALDIIYSISADNFSEDGIAAFLVEKKCVFRWGGVICENAQQVMFENIYEEETGFLIGEQYIERDGRNEKREDI